MSTLDNLAPRGALRTGLPASGNLSTSRPRLRVARCRQWLVVQEASWTLIHLDAARTSDKRRRGGALHKVRNFV
jgi:hypothetical protein